MKIKLLKMVLLCLICMLIVAYCVSCAGGGYFFEAKVTAVDGKMITAEVTYRESEVFHRLPDEIVFENKESFYMPDIAVGDYVEGIYIAGALKGNRLNVGQLYPYDNSRKT